MREFTLLLGTNHNKFWIDVNLKENVPVRWDTTGFQRIILIDNVYPTTSYFYLVANYLMDNKNHSILAIFF
jgi:hypothetical protein